MKVITLRKPTGFLTASVNLPASKSISNRLLILQALSGKDFTVSNLSDAADTRLLQSLLQKIRERQNSTTELNTGNTGTAMRFLTALLAITPGKWILTGDDRMKNRPIGPLVNALQTLGASVNYLGKTGYPPLEIIGKSLCGREIELEAGVSSQYISALMMIAPLLPFGLTILPKGKISSLPYITMTSRLLEMAGICVEQTPDHIRIHPSQINTFAISVEPDWSSAAFWYEAAALSQTSDILLQNLTPESLQGDAVLPAIFKHLGVKSETTASGVRLSRIPLEIKSFSYDFTDCPDIAPPVMTTCAALGIKCDFYGVRNLKIKETDRLAALKTEFAKFGADLRINGSDPDSATLFPGRKPSRDVITFNTWNDHRMAMSFAPLAARLNEIRIESPEVVEKSYPEFWHELQGAGFELL